MLELRVRRQTPRLDALPRTLPGRARRLVAAIVQGHAETARAHSRVRTGAQRASVYWAVAGGQGDAARALARAQGLNPDARLFPPLAPPTGRGPAGAGGLAACGVEYGIYNDRGHHGWPGDGWWTQSVARTRARWRAHARDLWRG